MCLVHYISYINYKQEFKKTLKTSFQVLFVLACRHVQGFQCGWCTSRGQGILSHDFLLLGWDGCVSLVLKMAQGHQMILRRKVKPYINRDLRGLKVCVTLF